jgi:C4-dicarboxylate transporter DctQ subunit
VESQKTTSRNLASTVFDRVLDGGLVAAGGILAFLMLTVFLDVILRDTGHAPLPWALEYVQYGLLFMTFLGAGWVLKKEAHVSLDLVLSKVSTKCSHLLQTINSIVCALICFILTYYGAALCHEQFISKSYQPTPMETPDFIVFGVIPLGTLLLTIQFIRRAYNNFLSWKDLHEAGRRPLKSDPTVPPPVLRDDQP